MGIFSKPKPPKPINVQQVGGQQQTANLSTANTAGALNRPASVTNQYGNQQTWQNTGTAENPNWVGNTTLGQTGQEFQTGFSGLGAEGIRQSQYMLGNRPDMSGMEAFNKGNQLFSEINDPMFARRREAERNRLANMGHDPRNSSDPNSAYSVAMGDVDDAESRARRDFALSFQPEMASQAQTDWGNRIAQMQSLSSPGTQYGMNAVNNTGGFAQAQPINLNPVDYVGLNNANQAQQQAAFAQKNAAYQAALGGAAGIAGAALGGPMGGALAGKMFGGQPLQGNGFGTNVYTGGIYGTGGGSTF